MASYWGTLVYTEDGGCIEIEQLIVRLDGLSFEATEITPAYGRWDCAGQARLNGVGAYVTIITSHKGTLTASYTRRIESSLARLIRLKGRCRSPSPSRAARTAIRFKARLIAGYPATNRTDRISS